MNPRPLLNRQRPLGELIQDSFAMFFGDMPSLFMIVAPALLVSLATQLLAQLPRQENTVLIEAIFLGGLPFLFAAEQLVTAGVCFRLLQLDQRKETSVGDALDAAQDHFADLMLAEFKALAIIMFVVLGCLGAGLALVVTLGWVGVVFASIIIGAGIVFAIHRGICWLFLIQAIMIDGQKGRDALAYSAALVKDNWWRTFGRSAVVGLVIGIPTSLLAGILQAAIPGIGGILFSSLPNLATFSFLAVSATLMFYDLKAKKAVSDNEPASPA